jgi:hypothetical protein
MEIREIQPIRLNKVVSCQEKNCNRTAKYTVFSDGKPRNFFRMVCKSCSHKWFDIQKGMRR